MGFLGGIIGGALGAVGSIFGANKSAESVNNANEMQYKMFKEGQEFNKEVMQNKHQWEYEDYRKAGINPLLTATSASGTLSTPSSGSMQSAKYDYSGIAQSAAAFHALDIQNKQAEAQLSNARAAEANAESNKRNADTLAARLDFDSGKAFELQRDYYDLSAKQTESNISSAAQHTEYEKALTMRQKIENVYMPDLMELKLTKEQQGIALAAAQTVSQIELNKALGHSAVTNAETNRMFAQNAERLGVSQSALNYTNISKVQHEVKQLRYDQRWQGDSAYDFSDTFGRMLSNMAGIRFFK